MSKMILTQEILAWYSENKRNLPWRKTHNPYRILVSEVMLQQTQVERVIPKYKAFLKHFPTVQKLANAKTADVIKAWAGLGYNRRALFLQRTAQAVVTQYKGKFPRDLELLKELPGIGDYTARAILSFAFRVSVPMMDTNHRKFYQRTYFGEKIQSDQELLKKAERVIRGITPPAPSPKRGGNIAYAWNQALMDFMTAVARESTDPLVVWYQTTFPATPNHPITSSPDHKKKTIRFEETDRYFRGRIIDVLRKSGKTTELLLCKKFSQIPKARVQKIVQKLEKDGLISRKNKSIVLP